MDREVPLEDVYTNVIATHPLPFVIRCTLSIASSLPACNVMFVWSSAWEVMRLTDVETRVRS